MLLPCLRLPSCCFFVFFFNDTATTEIYTLSLHDALPILCLRFAPPPGVPCCIISAFRPPVSQERPMTVKAYVLVVTDPGKTKRVVQAMRNVPGIVDMHEVMGPYDIVVEIEVQNLQDIPPILGEKIRAIEGIESTTSLVTLPD